MVQDELRSMQHNIVPIRPEFILPITSSDQAPAKKQKPNTHTGFRARNKASGNDSRKGYCTEYLRKNTCRFDEYCKYSHDLKAYLSERPECLLGNCVLFDLYGFCKYGHTCRFANAHGEHWDTKKGDDGYCNYLEPELRIKIRKKGKGLFTKSEALIKQYKSYKKNQETDGVFKMVDNRFQGIYPEFEKSVDFKDKLILAPLTTVGNLPFRRICKEFGADITCGEMAMAKKLIQGSPSEWALIRRHKVEDVFGVQLCGSFVDDLAKATELISEHCSVDFIDLNVGCPIDSVSNAGAGSGLMRRSKRLDEIIRSMVGVSKVPITVKMRTGLNAGEQIVDRYLDMLKLAGVSTLTVHGRTKKQRYSKLADWQYLSEVYPSANEHDITFIGNGDVYNFTDYYKHKEHVDGVMIARGALVKPWLFQEIKERRDIDISSTERFEMLKKFANYGLEHWGSDTVGVEKTRRFLLEWLSFLYRYVPVGIVESGLECSVQLNWRPPAFTGRNDLETLMGSSSSKDWVKITSLLLGNPEDDFSFTPKHKANAYAEPAKVDI